MLLYDPARVAAAMDQAGVEALVASSAPNVLYLTRYRGPERPGAIMAVLRRRDLAHPVLVLPSFDLDFVLEDRVDAVPVHTYGTFYRTRAEGVPLTADEAWAHDRHTASRASAGVWDLVAEALQGVSAVALEAADGSTLARLLPGAQIKAGTGLFRQIRMVKTAAEIARLTEAARITEQAIYASVSVAALGVTQRHLARAFNVSVAHSDARTRLDNASIDGGAAFCNRNVPGDVIRDGSLIRYDVGVLKDGYCSDMSRCFVFRHAPEKVARYYDALLAGQEAALAVLRPGITAAELFGTAVGAVRAAGIRHYDRTNVGHGIGVAGAGYDAPLLAPSDQTPIEAGMVLCIETPYYEYGFAGLQVEDMVVVTETGYRFLTQTDRRLKVVP